MMDLSELFAGFEQHVGPHLDLLAEFLGFDLSDPTMREIVFQAGLFFNEATARARVTQALSGYALEPGAFADCENRKYLAAPPDHVLGAALVLSCASRRIGFAESWWEWFSTQTICDVCAEFRPHDPMTAGDDSFHEPYLSLKQTLIRYFELLCWQSTDLPLDWPVEVYADCFHAVGLSRPNRPPRWLSDTADWPRKAGPTEIPADEDDVVVRVGEQEWSALSRQLCHDEPQLRQILEKIANQSIPIVDELGDPLLMRDLIYLRLRRSISLQDLGQRLQQAGCVSKRRPKGNRVVQVSQNNLSKINARYLRQPLRKLCQENLERLGVDDAWVQQVAPKTEFNEQLFPPLPRRRKHTKIPNDRWHDQ